MTAVIKVVRLASTMVVVARSNPFRIAIRNAAPRDNSSRILSKISTFASTDIPIVRTKPANPVNVRLTLISIKMAMVKIRFKASAMHATMPQNR